MRIKDIIDVIENFYPTNLAEEWDKVGLQLGNKNKEITNVMTVLEITEDVISEAVEKNVELLVVHHPLIFKPMNCLLEGNSNDEKIINLIKNDIAVYVIHTNIDVAFNGINDWLSEVIGIKKKRILKYTKSFPTYNVKIESNLINTDEILDLLPKIGIGTNKKRNSEFIISPRIKQYTLDNKIKEKDIVVIETTVDEAELKELKNTLSKLYFNNKVRTNIEVTVNEQKKLRFGIGRYGYITPVTLEDLASKISNEFSIEDVKIVGSRERIISKVAVVGGSGKSLIDDAYNRGCDVLITGDIGFHDAMHAKELGLSLIDASHYLEIIFNDGMATFLKLIDGINVYSSDIDTNPFELI